MSKKYLINDYYCVYFMKNVYYRRCNYNILAYRYKYMLYYVKNIKYKKNCTCTKKYSILD